MTAYNHNEEHPKSHLNYRQFKRPFVRDLAFALACPSLLTSWSAVLNELTNHSLDTSKKSFNIRSNNNIDVHSNDFWQQQFSNYEQRLMELDRTNDYQALTKFLLNRPSPHRLGFHFEGLILFWLLDGYKLGLHEFEVLAHNIQVIEDKVTLGELDLIIHNTANKQIEHWELAIKFYLGSAPFKPIDWVGLNRKDNLERKLIHMMNKPFSNNSAMVDKQSYQITKRYAVIKGRLFYQKTKQTKQLHTVSKNQSSKKLLNKQSTVEQARFNRPLWLNTDFPLHTWSDAIDTLIDDNMDRNLLLRKASYIEWFTPRYWLGYEYGISNQVETNQELLRNPDLEPTCRHTQYDKSHTTTTTDNLNKKFNLQDIDTGLYLITYQKKNGQKVDSYHVIKSDS